jgi:hypothetical protein
MDTKIVSIAGGRARVLAVAAALALSLGCGPVLAKDLVAPDSREVYVGHGRTACDGSAEDCANNHRDTRAVNGQRNTERRDKDRRESDRHKTSRDHSGKSHKESRDHHSDRND